MCRKGILLLLLPGSHVTLRKTQLPLPVLSFPFNNSHVSRSFIHGKEIAGVNDDGAANLIVTLTEIEYEEGRGPGLFSCHSGLMGACYPEVCRCVCMIERGGLDGGSKSFWKGRSFLFSYHHTRMRANTDTNTHTCLCHKYKKINRAPTPPTRT